MAATQTEMEMGMERHEADYKTSAGKNHTYRYLYSSSLVLSESAAASLRDFGVARCSQCTRAGGLEEGCSLDLGCKRVSSTLHYWRGLWA